MKFNSTFPKKSCLALSVSAAIALTGSAGFVYAQDDDASISEEIVVTGSRIRRQDFVANSPIVTVDQGTFEDTSTIGLDTILNQLPQFIPGVTGGGSGTVNQGVNSAQQFGTGGSQFAAGGILASAYATPGTSSVNLRGLGAGRNLVLIDGRRGMPVDASMTVDLNTIPSSAVERIEVVSGGASAVYGADAVAGAVNFILKDDFEGFELKSNYSMSQQGDAEEYRISALFGASTADGRGNVMVGMEHSSRAEGDFNKRDWFKDERADPRLRGNQLFTTDAFIGFFDGTFAGSADAINAQFPELEAGTLPWWSAVYANPDDSGTVYTGGSFFGTTFNPEGGYAYTGPFLHTDGFPRKKINPEGGIAENQTENWISVPLERYSAFARGKYDITDNVSAFVNLTYARSITQTSNQYSPAVTGWAAHVPAGDSIYPGSFVDAAAANLGTDADGNTIWDPTAPVKASYQAGGSLRLNCPATGGCANSSVWPMPREMANIVNASGAETVRLSKVLDFLGERATVNTTNNYQLMAGLEGELDNGYYWDVSVSHGESEAITRLDNYASLQRYSAVMNHPNYGVGFVQSGNPLGGNWGAGTGNCTSGLPIFEKFEMSEDCADAIRANVSQYGRMQQDNFDANLGGTLLEMPAGPLQFAAGVAYRKNKYEYYTSDNNIPSNFYDQPIGHYPNDDTLGNIGVKEVYGELLIPLVSDGPAGMRSLNLEIGGRISDYYSTSGKVDTAKALIDWLVVDWARFRGGLQRATRAPNINELFTGRARSVWGAGSDHGDVCSYNNYETYLTAATQPNPENGDVPQSTAAQAAQTESMCRSMMGAAADIYYDVPLDEMPDDGSGIGQSWIQGNRDVNPEEGETWTAGLVLTSPFSSPWLEGLTASLDYYQIEMSDMISLLQPDTILERCFDVEKNPTADLNNEYCRLMSRNAETGETLSADVTYTNETKSLLSGIDLNLTWGAQFADLGIDAIPGGMGINMLATIPRKIETQIDAETDSVDWVGHQGGTGCPTGVSCTGYDYTLFTTFNYFNGPWNASLRWQHYPEIKSGALVNNPASTALGVHDAYNVFALTGSYRMNDVITLSGGIENLFDEEPPLSGGDADATPWALPPTHAGGGVYDVLGRRFYVSVNASF